MKTRLTSFAFHLALAASLLPALAFAASDPFQGQRGGGNAGQGQNQGQSQGQNQGIGQGMGLGQKQGSGDSAGSGLLQRDRIQDRDTLYLGAQSRLRDHDRDRDGFISTDEYNTLQADTFSALSPNGEGLTLQAYLAAHLGPGPYGAQNPPRQTMMQARAQARKTERFRIMDGNGDGIVTRNEFMNFGKLNYLEADANDDGKVTYQELQQTNRGM